MNGPWVDGKTNQRDSCVILITQIFSVHNVSEMATKKHFCFANCSWRLGAFNSITIQQEYQVFRKVPLVTSEPVNLEAMISCNHPLSQFNVTWPFTELFLSAWLCDFLFLDGLGDLENIRCASCVGTGGARFSHHTATFYGEVDIRICVYQVTPRQLPTCDIHKFLNRTDSMNKWKLKNVDFCICISLIPTWRVRMGSASGPKIVLSNGKSKSNFMIQQLQKVEIKMNEFALSTHLYKARHIWSIFE